MSFYVLFANEMSKSAKYNSTNVNDNTEKYQDCWFRIACMFPAKKISTTCNTQEKILKEYRTKCTKSIKIA